MSASVDIDLSSNPLIANAYLFGDYAEPPTYDFKLEVSDDGTTLSGAFTGGGGGGGSIKPWLHRNFMDRLKSTARDYPPKRKKPWRHKDFVTMEHFHWDNDTPFGEQIAEPIDCGSRELQVIVDPWNLDCDETQFTVRAVGQVFGELRWHVTVDDEETLTNALSIIEEERIQSELFECGDTQPNIVTFIAIDDCGFAAGNLSMDGCPAIECGYTPVITGPESIPPSSGGQYSVFKQKGEATWSIAGGSGATISSTGYVTTNGSACGPATVFYSDCCGSATFDVRLGDATTSEWVFDSEENATGCSAFGYGEPCVPVVGGTTSCGSFCFSCTSGHYKYEALIYCVGSSTCSTEPELPACFEPDCGACTPLPDYTPQTRKVKTYVWACK